MSLSKIIAILIVAVSVQANAFSFGPDVAQATKSKESLAMLRASNVEMKAELVENKATLVRATNLANTLAAAPEPASKAEAALLKSDIAALTVVNNQMEALILSIDRCTNPANIARNLCLTSLSPKIQTAVTVVGGLMSVVNMTSLVESCSKFANAMDLTQKALTAYNAACGGAQMMCENSCTVTVAEADKMKAAIDALVIKSSTMAVDLGSAKVESTAAVTKLQMASTDQLGVCKSYKMTMAAAGVGIMGALNQKGMADECKKATATVDCADPINALNESCKTTLDCNKTENAQNATCICNKAPNTAGCPGALAGSGSGNSGSGTVGSDTGSFGSNAASGGGGLNLQGGADAIPTVSPTGSLGGSDGQSGGAGGGAGLSGGGAGADGQDDKKAANKLNTNIIGGYEGGGGGGGGRSAASANSAYGAYMPGAANDPSKNAGATTFANGEVTGGGSKSNWQKVRERYGANKSSLMDW